MVLVFSRVSHVAPKTPTSASVTPVLQATFPLDSLLLVLMPCFFVKVEKKTFVCDALLFFCRLSSRLKNQVVDS